jgi:cytochrome P450
VALQPGEVVMAHLGSANRDDAMFVDPDDLRTDRHDTRIRNLHFGMGVHRCVGMHLARTELRIGFERLLARTTAFRLQPGASVEFLTGMSCGPRSLPVEFERRG